MTPLTFHLPWPPSANHYWRHVGPKVLLSKEGRDYRKTVADEVLVQSPRLPSQPLGGRLRVWVQVFPPDQRARDLDNLNKSLLDALQHAGVFVSDSQIDDLRLLRQPGHGKPGYVVVTVSLVGKEA